MTPLQSIKTCLAKSFVFSGRASRANFWWLVLAVLLMTPPIGLLDYWLFERGTYSLIRQGGQASFQINAEGPVTTGYLFLSLISLLSVAVRRLHDVAKSGYVLLSPLAAVILILIFAPMMFGLFGQVQGRATLLSGAPALVVVYAAIPVFFSVIGILWWLSSPSQPGPNRYGPNPHEVPQ